jgi:magnesium transporter
MAAAKPIPSLNWYDIADPASPDLDELARKFHLHELQIEDIRHGNQRAKTEEHEKYVFTVLKKLHTTEEVHFHDFDMFLGSDFLITVHKGSNGFIDEVRHRVEQNQVNRLDRLFHAIIDMVVDEYQPLLDCLSDKISEIESEVLERPDPDVLSRIFRLKRDLILFRRIAGAMREVVNAIIRRERGLVGDDLDPYFRDVYDHLVRTVELIESDRDLLTGSLDIYLSAVANRTNEVMKVLTIYGTIALPLIIITGFFGMNFPLGWEHNPEGIWYAVGLMVASTAAVLAYFKRKHWF